jgi:hypothetical protein
MKMALLKDEAGIFKYIGVWFLCGLVAYFISIPMELMFASPRPSAADYWMKNIATIALAGISTILVYSSFETLNKRKVIPWIVTSNLIASVLVYVLLHEIDFIHAVLTIISLQIFSLFFYYSFHKDDQRFDNSQLPPHLGVVKIESSNAPTASNAPNFKDSANFSDPADDKWAMAYSEFESEKRDLGLYARLYSQYQGEEAKIKAAYLKERAAHLQLQFLENSREIKLRRLIEQANIFLTQDGYVIGIKNPLIFLVFQNEKFTFLGGSTSEVENKYPSFQDRKLIIGDKREVFLKGNIERIILETNNLDV